jgi:murein L,D-transpeptidase YcbB/YkuD
MKTISAIRFRSLVWILCASLLITCHQAIKPYLYQSSQANNTAGYGHEAAPKHIAFDSSLLVSTPGPGLPLPPVQNRYGNKVKEKTQRFYKLNGYKTKWLTDRGPSNLYYVLVQRLKNSWEDGLLPSDYGLDELNYKITLAQITNGIQDLSKLVQLDIEITERFFLYTTHLHDGKVNQTGYGRNVWQRTLSLNQNPDVLLLVNVSSAAGLLYAIEKLQPLHPQYEKLKTALKHYRSLQSQAVCVGHLAAGEKIEPMCSHRIIPSLRRHMLLIRELQNPKADSLNTLTFDSLYYDEWLVDAVKHFQSIHGIEADGILGERTLKFINQSFKDKADIIALNMERLRWSPANYGENFILVNIPEYKLRLYNQQKQALEMKVIVGAIDNATPVFNDDLEYIVFSPTWTVPPRILKEEIIPNLQKNPLYYSEKNYTFYKNNVEIDPASEVWNETVNPYQYRVVQQPGSDNSLGRVKFIMPNNMNVYLHDTPSRRLFKKFTRALSHGCIRLEQPRKLAEYLLSEQGWDEDRINQALEETDPLTVLLRNRYKVYLQYQTAWVDEQGVVNFREDIYGHDRHQLTQLFPSKGQHRELAGL